MSPKLTIELLLVALLGVAAAYVVRNAEPAPLIKQKCIDADMQDKIHKLYLQALDLAFTDHVQLLFDVWTKDPSTAIRHPERAQVGMDHLINAYVYAQQLGNKWTAPTCPVRPVGVDPKPQ